MENKSWVLPIIVISQFCCTSLWFAGNGVMSELIHTFHLQESAVGHLTSAVQFGFITGTLFFAILTIADRFSASRVFFLCAIAGAIVNVGMIWEHNTFASLLTLRFFTGIFLAGIYPVGMKIAADYFEKGLGKSLGYLVGALVVGTAFPHLLKGGSNAFMWQHVLIITSFIAATGGLLMIYFVGDGPYRKRSQGVDLKAFFSVFKNVNFRAPAFGYFGHMWELYAFWAFVPIMLQSFQESMDPSFNISIWSFAIIAIGGIGCVFAGYLSQRIGSKLVAAIALSLSCLCCLLSPFILAGKNLVIVLSFLLFWGMTVVADSPLFSTLVAQNAPEVKKGTALTIVNCIGFSITILSIQLINSMQDLMSDNYLYVLLAIGPVLGLVALFRNREMMGKI